MVVVIDSIMGSGKTTYMINHINRSYEELCVDGAYNPFAEHKRYMYVTPFLTEVQRIKEACPKLDFRSPVNKGGAKLNHLMDLVRDGCNVVMTHSLFQHITPELSRLINKMKYTLILDEEMQCIDIDKSLSASDKKILENSDVIMVGSDGSIGWNEEDHGTYGGGGIQ